MSGVQHQGGVRRGRPSSALEARIALSDHYSPAFFFFTINNALLFSDNDGCIYFQLI